MKKHIMKLAALLFSVALLALPGTAFSFRQITPGVSTYSIPSNDTYAAPIPDDTLGLDMH